MSGYSRLWPGKTFEDAGGVCALTDVVITAPGATNNTVCVAAVTGKVIMIVSGNLRSAGVTTAATFKSASAGTNKRAYQVPVNTAATPNVILESDMFGVFRSNAGEGIYVDNTGADALTVSLTYITYTP